jgi:hypothetical protein
MYFFKVPYNGDEILSFVSTAISKELKTLHPVGALNPGSFVLKADAMTTTPRTQGHFCILSTPQPPLRPVKKSPFANLQSPT